MIKTLLDAGADIAARDSAGGSALHAAALGGHVDAARVLLEAGSDYNAIDQGTNTPLHALASTTAGGGWGAGVELVTLLLQWGASVDIKDSKGLTAVAAALDARNRSLVLAYRVFFGDEKGLEETTNTAGLVDNGHGAISRGQPPERDISTIDGEGDAAHKPGGNTTLNTNQLEQRKPRINSTNPSRKKDQETPERADEASAAPAQPPTAARHAPDFTEEAIALNTSDNADAAGSGQVRTQSKKGVAGDPDGVGVTENIINNSCS